jgi:hypothetical protein
MKVETVADLLPDEKTLSPRRIDIALATAAPLALARCADPATCCTRMELRNGIVHSLRSALDIGIAEAVIRDWLPLQNLPATTADINARDQLAIDLIFRSEIFKRSAGVPVLRVGIVARLQLTQRGSTLRRRMEGCGAVVGEARAWHARLELALSDHAPHVRGGEFHEIARDVYLPPQPWPKLA